MSGIMQLLLASRPQAVPDPYFEYTTLLLPGNGTNGAQNNTFLDSSTNAFSITRNGNTTQGTFSPFSQTGWGNYFDGTGDYLTTANGSNSFGTGDWTIEFWVNSAQTSRADPFGWNYSFSSAGWAGFIFNLPSSGDMAWYEGTNQRIIASAANWNNNQWNHVAISRSGNSVKMFLNGTQVGSTYTTSYSYGAASSGFIIGAQNGGAGPLAGYISNLRVVNGTAVYTANFTPPTTPLTAITNTALLTCQSNRFIDNSTNNFAITRNGDVSVQAFSPFNPTAAWSAATNGGSGYFDGSGDYISAPSNAAFALPGDFTFEAWIYPTSWSASVMPVFVVYLSTIGGLWVGKNGSNFVLRVAGVADQLTTTTLPTLNAWTHIAVVRSGTTATIYYNGVSIVSGTVTYSFVQEQANVAGDTTGSAFSGYISSLRLVKGTAVYTSAFTPPTAPLTAITNTSLLTNFTNAGIYDATSKNDLETVGNAQISTTQSKFGGSSMYFDGSGDYLIGPSSQNFALNGDYTIEAWAYINSFSTNPIIVDTRNNGTSTTGVALYFNSSGNAVGYINSANRIVSSATYSTATWHHIALVRVGSTNTLYVNGNSVGTYSFGTALTDTSITVGTVIDYRDGSSTFKMNGYINDLRITKGYARYTTNFTPPTAAFPLL